MLFNTKSTLFPTVLALVAAASSVSAVPAANLHNGRGEPPAARLHHRQASSSSSSAVSPTAPGPGDKFQAGGDCTTEWDAGSDPAWKEFDIDLMTGSNTQMTKLGTIATGLDGSDTTKTSITYKCPEVSPYSAIYFYQYTPKGSSSGDPAWTTRFTITDASGNSTPEPQKVQPDGKKIPWGTGKLLSSASSGSAMAGDSANSTSASSSGSSASTSSASSTSDSASPSSTSSSDSSASSQTGSQQSSSSSSSDDSDNSKQQTTSSSQSPTSGSIQNVASGSGLFVAIAVAAVAASGLVL
ncbi:unnamed protein product [Sympodiomycopsis kandeliae]